MIESNTVQQNNTLLQRHIEAHEQPRFSANIKGKKAFMYEIK